MEFQKQALEHQHSRLSIFTDDRTGFQAVIIFLVAAQNWPRWFEPDPNP
jgi:hypothetical protein